MSASNATAIGAAAPGAPLLRAAFGAALLLMLVALLPSDIHWATPAAFGHSGAFEIFLFAAGWALAPFLLHVFREKGFRAGALRAAHRVWQIYWRALGAVLVAAALAILVYQGPSVEALRLIDLSGVVEAPHETLLGLATLILQPGFFGALHCYIIILALTPAFAALGAARPALAVAFSLALYALALAGLTAPGDWRLDPLAWQLPFFAAFALAAGWIKAPAPSKLLTRLAVAALVLSIVADPDGLIGGLWRETPTLLEQERAFGPLRAAHFAALVYLLAVFGPRLLERASDLAPQLLRRLQKLGDQPLVGLVAIHPIAALLLAADASLGGGFVAALLSVVIGVGLLVLAIEIARWFDDPPWAKPGRPTPEPAGDPQ